MPEPDLREIRDRLVLDDPLCPVEPFLQPAYPSHPVLVHCAAGRQLAYLNRRVLDRRGVEDSPVECQHADPASRSLYRSRAAGFGSRRAAASGPFQCEAAADVELVAACDPIAAFAGVVSVAGQFSAVAADAAPVEPIVASAGVESAAVPFEAAADAEPVDSTAASADAGSVAFPFEAAAVPDSSAAFAVELVAAASVAEPACRRHDFHLPGPCPAPAIRLTTR